MCRKISSQQTDVVVTELSERDLDAAQGGILPLVR